MAGNLVENVTHTGRLAISSRSWLGGCCSGPDPLLADRETSLRVEGRWDRLDGAAQSTVVGVVPVGDEVHEGGVAAEGA